MENRQPLLSICIPTYNRVEHVSSLLKFLYKEYEDLSFDEKKKCEILVRDNCSTDETEKCITNYLSSRKFATYHRNNVNVGATNNFLLLSQEATGEYVWWLGDDDELKVGIIKKVLNSLNAYTPSMLFINHIRRANKNAPVIISSAVDKDKTDFYEDGRQAIADIIGFGDVGNVLFMSAKVVRTDLLLKACNDLKLPDGSLPLYIGLYAASMGNVAIIKEPMMENIIGEISWRDRADLIAFAQIPSTLDKMHLLDYSAKQIKVVKKRYFTNDVKIKILLYKLKILPYVRCIYKRIFCR